MDMVQERVQELVRMDTADEHGLFQVHLELRENGMDNLKEAEDLIDKRSLVNEQLPSVPDHVGKLEELGKLLEAWLLPLQSLLGVPHDVREVGDIIERFVDGEGEDRHEHALEVPGGDEKRVVDDAAPELRQLELVAHERRDAVRNLTNVDDGLLERVIEDRELEAADREGRRLADAFV
jgi:hypothetical protein